MICPTCKLDKTEDHFNEHSTCWACRKKVPVPRCGECHNQQPYCSCARSLLDPDDREWLNQMSEHGKVMDHPSFGSHSIFQEEIKLLPPAGPTVGVKLPPKGMFTVLGHDGNAIVYNPNCEGCATCAQVEAWLSKE